MRCRPRVRPAEMRPDSLPLRATYAKLYYPMTISYPTARSTAGCTAVRLQLQAPSLELASDFRSGALPLPFSGHSISFARLPVLPFSGRLPVFPRENAFSNNFQKNAAFWKNPENIWLNLAKIQQKSGKILEILEKNSKKFSNF